MSRIAILDTAVSSKNLHCRKFYAYNIGGGREEENLLETSHGTVCARVLDNFTVDYELFSIQIMENSTMIGGKPMGNIQNLKRGLQLCLELDVDIVCMSSVSSLLSDSNILYFVAKELARKSILVAALDNRRYFTVPTGYPFVVGVQLDRENTLNSGEIAYNEKDLFGAGLYANCNVELLKELGNEPSNSYAVPIVAARINTWKNQGKDIGTEIRNLKPYLACGMLEEVSFKRKLGMCREVPLAIIYASGDENLYEVCRVALDYLYDKYQVQASALCSMTIEDDVRFRKLESMKDLRDELLFMEYCYKTDLIFLIIKEQEGKEAMLRADADLEIVINGEKASILFENGHTEDLVDNLADMVYDILQ